jgi:lysophospholipase L1-like esterase
MATAILECDDAWSRATGPRPRRRGALRSSTGSEELTLSRRRSFDLLVLLAATALAGLGAEGFARLALPLPERGNLTPVPRTLTERSPWPGLPYRLRPGAEGRHAFPSDPRGYFDPDASLSYRINALGFRGPETTLAKPPGRFRIVGLGDSFTFGTGVRVEHTFLAVLEKRLAEAQGAEGIEVLNLGVMGFDTPQEVALLRQLGLELGPDFVVICFFLNDARGGAVHARFNAAPGRPGALWRSSHLLELVAWQLERRRQVSRLVSDYERSFAADAPGWVAARRALAEAAGLAQHEGFDLALTIFPVLWQLSGDYPFRAIHETVRREAEGLGIAVHDLLPAFQGHDGPELWVHPTNQHPNEIAHAIAGESLARFLSPRLPSRAAAAARPAGPH